LFIKLIQPKMKFLTILNISFISRKIQHLASKTNHPVNSDNNSSKIMSDPHA
jgi:hypothetical protein